MFRKHTPKGRQNRTTSAVPGIEKLESRQLMAGDGLPLISVSAPTQVSRTSDADFWIRLDRPVAAGETLDVQYTTRAIGALASRDFQATTATAHFEAGESSKVINVATRALPASAAESAKPCTFALDITSASSGKVVQKTAVTHIVNEAAGFQIDISFSGNVSDKTKVAAREAADKWQSVITGDLASVVVDGEYIDDFKLVVKEQQVDGLNGALAYASPTRTNANGQYVIQKRGSSNTSHGGTAVVDIADRDNKQIKDIMVHELGHALGIGPFWTLEYIRSSFKPLGLVKNLFTDSPIYVGRYALAEYRKLAPGAIGVPLESGGGGGTRAAHWSEDVFGDELMTGYLSPTMPLSRVTVGALQDLGYSVNYAKADPYSLPKPTVVAAGLSASNGLSTRLADSTLSPGMNFAGNSTTTVSGGTSAAGSTTTTLTTTTQQPLAPARPATGTRQFVIVRQGQAPVTSTTPATVRPTVA
ncbi:MAG: leishmanolysin-related zinc metalloendopeptidase, partial [Planctomycetia bacterium]